MNLADMGWDDFFVQQFAAFANNGFFPARVALEHRELYRVYTEQTDLAAEVTGKLRHQARSRADFPAVGDWVVVAVPPDENRAIIHTVLPRKSKFSRRAVLSGGMPETGGETDEQVLAANVDTVFLVSALDGDFNLRRIERFLAVAWDSGALPVIVLNKADKCDNPGERKQEAEAVAVGIPIYTISAAENEGLDVLQQHLGPGKTAVFLGSSGVGKSAIINRLLGAEQLKVTEIRENDSRGRHTTTHRELVLLPDGGIVIDTPGLRTLKMWSDDEGLERVFGDIEEFALACRFRDCKHQDEPGCAIQRALADGTLDAGRYTNYLKLQKELNHLVLRQDVKARRQAIRSLDKKHRQYHQQREELRKKGLI